MEAPLSIYPSNTDTYCPSYHMAQNLREKNCLRAQML